MQKNRDSNSPSPPSSPPSSASPPPAGQEEESGSSPMGQEEKQQQQPGADSGGGGGGDTSGTATTTTTTATSCSTTTTSTSELGVLGMQGQHQPPTSSPSSSPTSSSSSPFSQTAAPTEPPSSARSEDEILTLIRNRRADRKACVNCRIAKVKCDKALPSCSRCFQRGERCEREGMPSGGGSGGASSGVSSSFTPITTTTTTTGGGDGGGGPTSPLSSSSPLGEPQRRTLLQRGGLLENAAVHFRQYCGLFVAAVRELQAKGGIERARAINTLRCWMLDNEEMARSSSSEEHSQQQQGGGGQTVDVTWGALEACLAITGITRDEVLVAMASTTAPPPYEFPTIADGCKQRLRLRDGWRDVDVSQSVACRSLDPAVPAMILAATGSTVLWMNEAAEEASFEREEINAAMRREKCLGLFLMTLNTSPADREDLMRAYAEHSFGRDMSTTCFGMVINQHGSPVLRLGRWRYKYLPEVDAVCTILTFQEAPASRHMNWPLKSRDHVIESFRQHQPPSPPTLQQSVSSSGSEGGDVSGGGGASSSPPQPSSPQPSSMEEGGGGGGDEVSSVSSGSSSSVAMSGAAMMMGGQAANSLAELFALTNLGKSIDRQRALEIWQSESQRLEPLSASLFAPPPSLDGSMGGGRGGGARGRGRGGGRGGRGSGGGDGDGGGGGVEDSVAAMMMMMQGGAGGGDMMMVGGEGGDEGEDVDWTAEDLFTPNPNPPGPPSRGGGDGGKGGPA